MYSKTEVCFTIVVTITASLYFSSSQPTADLGVAHEQTITTVDGGHPPPPPPIPPPSGTEPNRTELLFIADGGHPPPPPPPGASFASTDVLLADGGHPPPPPPPPVLSRTEMLQTDGGHPPQLTRLFAGLG